MDSRSVNVPEKTPNAAELRVIERRALLQFGRGAIEADTVVICYSGPSMEIGGENCLIPVDAELQSDRDRRTKRSH
jgi:uncharacterized caspase-like protein